MGPINWGGSKVGAHLGGNFEGCLLYFGALSLGLVKFNDPCQLWCVMLCVLLVPLTFAGDGPTQSQRFASGVGQKHDLPETDQLLFSTCVDFQLSSTSRGEGFFPIESAQSSQRAPTC